MKTLLAVIILSLPTLTSAAEYLDVECYIAEGTTVTKTFDGLIFGTVKNSGNRIILEGKNVATAAVHRPGTPDTCKSAYDTIWSDSGYSYESKVSNVYLYEFDYSLVDLSCAQGSVVKRYGDLANFRKAIEAQNRRNTYADSKPYCLDFSGLE